MGRFLEWFTLNLRGLVKGIMIFWDNRVLELIGIKVGELLISFRFKNCGDGFCWVFIGVYGLTAISYKGALWEELGAIRGFQQDPWCIGDDFNFIRLLVEWSRALLSFYMRRFSEVIED